MHLTYICRFLPTPLRPISNVYPHIHTHNSSLTTRSCECSNQPKASSSSAQALLRSKELFRPHPTKIRSLTRYCSDTTQSILNPLHFMISRQGIPPAHTYRPVIITPAWLQRNPTKMRKKNLLLQESCLKLSRRLFAGTALSVQLLGEIQRNPPFKAPRLCQELPVVLLHLQTWYIRQVVASMTS